MGKWVVDIHGEIEGDYEIIKKYEECLRELNDYKVGTVGCEYCKHEYRKSYERPCSLCQRNYVDMFERSEEK